MRRSLALLLVTIPLALAGGCGGSDEGSGSNEPNGIESMPPQQALEETAAALREVKSFHVAAKEGRNSTFQGDVADNELRLDLREGNARARMLLVDNSLYMRANAAFWRDANAGANAGELAGRWIKVPGSAAGADRLAKQVDPENLSRCLLQGNGTVTPGGAAIVAGEPAIVLIDHGDKPGTTPGRLYIASTGKPLPLRTVATGPERRGGKRDPLCDDQERTEEGDEIIFSRYDVPVDIKAPPDAIDLGRLPGSSAS